MLHPFLRTQGTVVYGDVVSIVVYRSLRRMASILLRFYSARRRTRRVKLRLRGYAAPLKMTHKIPLPRGMMRDCNLTNADIGRGAFADPLRQNIAINTCLTLLSLRQKAQRKKLGKKEMPLLRRATRPPSHLGSFLEKAPPKTKNGTHKRNAVSVGYAPTPRSLFWKKARQKLN